MFCFPGHRRISPENTIKKPTRLESLPVIGDRKVHKNTLDRI